MKDPAHGLPCLSVRIITGSFEQPMTQMKTKCVIFMNISKKF